MPDFGEARLHPTAGATVVGARKFLIAYNIFLNTPDVAIAKSIAKAVRFSSGGMRFVKAAGFLVRGLAQVSMNLTDFEQTPVHRVFELVRREAARYGVLPVSSEIVGLIPKRAVEQAAEWFLQLENFDSSLILENRLAAVVSGKMAVGGLRAGIEPFIEQLAAPTAVPGGGSAAAASAAMAAGLAGMVASMSRGKKAYAQYESQLSEALARLAVLREELKSAIDADAEAYNAVMKAYKSAKESADGAALDCRRVAAGGRCAPWRGRTGRRSDADRHGARTDHQSQHEIRPDDRDRTGQCCNRRGDCQCRDQSRIDEARLG